MRKVLKLVLALMMVLTLTYVGFIAYANASPSYGVNSSDDGKVPLEYGIWRAYEAERLETEPQEWNTTEELGITFGEKMKSAETETYLILIVDEKKALPWMNGTTPEPYAVKFVDSFYRIVSLWLTPGLPEPIRQWQFPMGAALGAGWAFTGVLFLRRRVKE